MSVDYKVRVLYEVDTSQAHARVGSLSSAFDGLGKFAGQVGSVMDSLASKLFTVGAAMGTAGALGAVAALKHGLIDVNASLEQTEIGMASTFQMLGATDSFTGGLAMAKELLAGIREDAAALPGEFADFAEMSRSITPALLNAGKGVQEIRDLTRQTAIAGANLLGGDFKTAGREMAMLLQGHATSASPLARNLGISAHTMVGGKAWNEATTSDRYEFLVKMLSKGDDALKAYSRSWSGLTSTMVDGAKRLLGTATGPLFERMKETIGVLNETLDSPKAKEVAEAIGHKLVVGYDFLIDKGRVIASHWGEIRDSALRFGTTLRHAFEEIAPIVEKIAGSIDGGTLKGLVGLRIGAGVVSNAGGIGAAASSPAALLAAPAGLAAVAVLDDVAGAAGRVATVFTEFWDSLVAAFEPMIEKGGLLRDVIGALGAGVVTTLEVALYPFVLATDAIGFTLRAVNYWWEETKAAVSNFITSSETLSAIVEGASNLFYGMVDAIKSVTREVADFLRTTATLGHAFNAEAVLAAAGRAAKPEPGMFAGMTDFLKLDTGKMQKAIGGMAGKGATNVTVNAPLTVLSDADPERLAMKVATHIAGTLRNPKTSITTPTFHHL